MNVHVLVEVVFRSDFFATNITSEFWFFVNLKVTRFIISYHNFTTNGTRPVRFVFSFRFSFRFFCTVHCFKMGCQFSRVVEDFTTNFTWWWLQNMGWFDMMIELTLRWVFLFTLRARKLSFWPFCVMLQFVSIKNVSEERLTKWYILKLCSEAVKVMHVLRGDNTVD